MNCFRQQGNAVEVWGVSWIYDHPPKREILLQEACVREEWRLDCWTGRMLKTVLILLLLLLLLPPRAGGRHRCFFRPSEVAWEILEAVAVFIASRME